MTKLRKIRFIVWSVCLLHLALPQVLLACPTCKDGLGDDGTAFAYACSILFMMAMPFAILTCWVTTIVRLRSQMDVSLARNLDD